MLFMSPALPPSTSSTPLSLSLPHMFFGVIKFLPPSPVQDFRAAVTEASAPGGEGEPVLEEQRLGEILGVLPQVYALHSSILAELEERISQW